MLSAPSSSFAAQSSLELSGFWTMVSAVASLSVSSERCERKRSSFLSEKIRRIEESAVTLLEASLPYLAETHLKDSRADRTPVLLGEGDTGFFEVAAHLAASDYAGWLVLENPYERLMAARGLSAEALLRKDVATIRECFGGSAGA